VLFKGAALASPRAKTCKADPLLATVLERDLENRPLMSGRFCMSPHQVQQPGSTYMPLPRTFRVSAKTATAIAGLHIDSRTRNRTVTAAVQKQTDRSDDPLTHIFLCFGGLAAENQVASGALDHRV
jgi:hypothetical protein